MGRAAEGDMFRGIPINSHEPGWCRINLLFPDKPTVSLLIDEINCYLVGFRRANGDWLKFDDQDLPNGVGVPLGFESNYNDLCEHLNKHKTVFGCPTLTNAYYILLNYNGDLKKVKKALLQMVVMFCEAVRFKLILEEIVNIMKEYKTSVLPPHMWDWTKNWHVLSAYAVDCKGRDANNIDLDDQVLLQSVAGLQVNNREDAARLLGLIMRKLH
ncbi:hypothetical protein QOZ80_5BG0430810 [Eleusine coracana subsp. coracana]|nr:hypothetical protein QOZ80_5BG0430810 [Eleusine coracana subsp. coracana]